MNDQLFPGGKRYNSYNEYFRRTFGSRVQKLSVDAGFTCPNRDGTVATGGCTYCNNDAFNPSYCEPAKSIRQQLEEGKQFHAWRYRRAVNYLAYFQAFSNTHAPLDRLKTLYEEALSVPGIVGLVIGTRPDCVDDARLDYFASLSRERYVIIEYGIESCYDATLKAINRGHDFAAAVRAVHETAIRGIHVGAHLIFGLPDESRRMILDSAAVVSQLPLTTIKFHQLQIIKGTAMEADYRQHPGKYHLYEPEEYIDLVVDFTERLNPRFVVERFSGEAPPRFVVAPDWGRLRADEIGRRIEKKLEEKETFQGRLADLFTSSVKS